jgi:hypothetical protein
MKAFRRRRSGVTADFGPDEAALLHVLVGDLLALLSTEDPRGEGRSDGGHGDADGDEVDPLVALTGMGGTAVDPGPPEDPVLARLFPDAYRLDVDPEHADAAADYRRFTTGDLHEQKAAGLRLVQATLPAAGGPVVLDDAAADAWLTALTDLRLALGVRLGVTDDLAEQLASDPPSPEDPRLPALEVFDFLGWLQETLVRAVAGW